MQRIILGIATSFALATSAHFAAAASQQNDYRLIAMDNCAVVLDVAMNPEQVEAYQNLRAEEKKMQAFENPLKDVEDEIEYYSEQIEQLSELAIQETDDSLYIDKGYLAQQEEMAKKLEAIIASHQGSFDDLERQGKRIGQVASTFELAVRQDLDGVEHDQVHIVSPESEERMPECHRSYYSFHH